MPTGRILFVLRDSRYFSSHRLPLALAAITDGYEVAVACDDYDKATWNALAEHGIRVFRVPFVRNGRDWFRVVKCLIATWRAVAAFKPSLVHAITIQSVIAAGVVALLKRLPFLALVAGKGSLYQISGARGLVLQSAGNLAYRLFMMNPLSLAVFMNEADRAYFVERNLVPASRAHLIRGSGVDIDRFQLAPLSLSPSIGVLMASRLYREKGVSEFLEAASVLHREFPMARFALAGDIDPMNPTSYSLKEVTDAAAAAGVSFLGYRTDMPMLLQEYEVFCLPSYHEGLPLSLLEAAATGRILVASDIPGCRAVIEDNLAGVLVEPKNAGDLTEKLRQVLLAPENFAPRARAARAHVEREFSLKQINQTYLELYRQAARNRSADRLARRGRIHLGRILLCASVVALGAGLSATWRASRMLEVRYRARCQITHSDELRRRPLENLGRQLTAMISSPPYARIGAAAAVEALMAANAKVTIQALTALSPENDAVEGLHKLLEGTRWSWLEIWGDHRFGFELSFRSPTLLEVVVSSNSPVIARDLARVMPLALVAITQRVHNDFRERERSASTALDVQLNDQVSMLVGKDDVVDTWLVEQQSLQMELLALSRSLGQRTRGARYSSAKRAVVAMQPVWLDWRSGVGASPSYASFDTADPASFIGQLDAVLESGLLTSADALALHDRLRRFLVHRSDFLDRSEAKFGKRLEILKTLAAIRRSESTLRSATILPLTLAERAIVLERAWAAYEMLGVVTCGVIGGVASAFAFAAFALLQAGFRQRMAYAGGRA